MVTRSVRLRSATKEANHLCSPQCRESKVSDSPQRAARRLVSSDGVGVGAPHIHEMLRTAEIALHPDDLGRYAGAVMTRTDANQTRFFTVNEAAVALGISAEA